MTQSVWASSPQPMLARTSPYTSPVMSIYQKTRAKRQPEGRQQVIQRRHTRHDKAFRPKATPGIWPAIWQQTLICLEPVLRNYKIAWLLRVDGGQPRRATVGHAPPSVHRLRRYGQTAGPPTKTSFQWRVWCVLSHAGDGQDPPTNAVLVRLSVEKAHHPINPLNTPTPSPAAGA